MLVLAGLLVIKKLTQTATDVAFDESRGYSIWDHLDPSRLTVPRYANHEPSNVLTLDIYQVSELLPCFDMAYIPRCILSSR